MFLLHYQNVMNHMCVKKNSVGKGQRSFLSFSKKEEKNRLGRIKHHPVIRKSIQCSNTQLTVEIRHTRIDTVETICRSLVPHEFLVY